MGGFKGVNAKAQEGRERKAAKKQLAAQKKQEEELKKEELKWQEGAKKKSRKRIETDSSIVLKQQKDREKLLLQAKEEEELSKLKPIKPIKVDDIKIKKKPMKTQQSPPHLPDFNFDNTIKTAPDSSVTYSASNIDDALFLLSSASASATNLVEKHPERRVKAAFTVFEQKQIPLLKAEFPTLRFSQIREKLYRKWKTSPENPFNQIHFDYNVSKSQETLVLSESYEKTLERLQFHQNK